MSAIAQKSVSCRVAARSVVRPSVVRPAAVRRNVAVRASAELRPAAVSAAVVTAVGAVLATPLVAEASVSPSLSNFLSSLVAGAAVLGGIAGAVTLVSRFDTISRKGLQGPSPDSLRGRPRPWLSPEGGPGRQAEGSNQNWGGVPDELDGKVLPMNTEAGRGFDQGHTPWMEQVGVRPQTLYFHNFLTNAERQHILRLAAPNMKRSTVVGPGGLSVVDPIRTSYGMFIRRRQDPVIERIEERIALWTQIPKTHQEDIQVLRYSRGQTYGSHYDSSYDRSELNGPKYRLATFLMYLSDVEEGGETAFPKNSEWADPSIPERMGQVSDCAKGHVAAKPKAGDAVMFYSYFPNKTMDPASMHTGCPVIKGYKWAAPVWIHVDEFRPYEMQGPAPRPPPQIDSGECSDRMKYCADLASKGECERDALRMKGDAANAGTCRKSCDTCEMCAAGDEACLNRNRAAAGYLELKREEMEWLGVGDLIPPAA
eukprot:gene14663-20698_t